ncbi:anti-sigma factor [Paracoccus aminophilus]|uniref:Transmembrane anti-sigma factor n=1 Tax=Paracoccus aminophilus JCM 7686 TaxID=1367847 RepID=S5Y236_PARAH|nr:hypothetical protein [Paracoccus aminophilus]AGT09805.1 hypothetical protein JCM7686_2749 [Paracoccus aminophilus JCM 7686]
MRADPPSEIEIEAFLIGQLDSEGRLAVASYLEREPKEAARVMGELRVLEGLRLALGEIDSPPSATLHAAAARFEPPPPKPASRRPFLAALAAVFALGWGAQMLWSATHPDPQSEFQSMAEAALDAMAAVEVSRDLAPTPTQPEAERLATRLGLAIPDLPPGWKIRAAQVVATPTRPGVALILDTPDMGEVMLLSVSREEDRPPSAPHAFEYRGNAIAIFGRNKATYVLVDNAGVPAELGNGAEKLVSRFN